MKDCKYYSKDYQLEGSCKLMSDWSTGMPEIKHCACDGNCHNYCSVNMENNLPRYKKEFVEWFVSLLSVRFDLKKEYYDPHSHNNFTYENAADCVWNAYIEPLLMQTEQKYKDGMFYCVEKLRNANWDCITIENKYDIANDYYLNDDVVNTIDELEKEALKIGEKYE